ncbi:MAG TPA: cytochrome d ubiquinol oxidase subunit II [Thermodesulfobacteriota bacterium]
MPAYEVVALVTLLGVLAYALLGGADFGGGVWDLFASGPRKEAQRRAIAVAMGPVWEANHVWLIFVIVVLFTAFPVAFRAMNVALFWPFHLVLVGIVLRGAAFAFRAHGHEAAGVPLDWGRVFGAASVITPVLLGASLGALSSGQVRVTDGVVAQGGETAWLGPFPLAVGVLALAVCAYLAAVYITLETEGPLREDFRRKGLWAWLVGGVVSLGTLLLTRTEAPRLWGALTTPPAGLVVVAGVLLAPASAVALWYRRFAWARVLAAGQVVLLLAGWAMAQWPFLIYPDLTVADSAAPPATLRAVLWVVPIGMLLLIPSLWYLFAVFKGENPSAARDAARDHERSAGR